MGVNENKGNVMIVYARFTQNRSKNCFFCCSTSHSLIRLFILEGKWQLSKSIGLACNQHTEWRMNTINLQKIYRT